MRRTKRKAITGSVILVAVPVIFMICFLVMYIMYVMGLSNAATTASYVDNVTHSTMLDFTMLNTNLINSGSFASPTRSCAKKTLLPVKYSIGIGLFPPPPLAPAIAPPYDVGYQGYETNMNLEKDCFELYLNSLGYVMGLTGGFSFAPSSSVPLNGPVNLYVDYNGNKYYSTIWPPKNPKITYAYITLPNEDVATVVIKTN